MTDREARIHCSASCERPPLTHTHTRTHTDAQRETDTYTTSAALLPEGKDDGNRKRRLSEREDTCALLYLTCRTSRTSGVSRREMMRGGGVQPWTGSPHNVLAATRARVPTMKRRCGRGADHPVCLRVNGDSHRRLLCSFDGLSRRSRVTLLSETSRWV